MRGKQLDSNMWQLQTEANGIAKARLKERRVHRQKEKVEIALKKERGNKSSTVLSMDSGEALFCSGKETCMLGESL